MVFLVCHTAPFGPIDEAVVGAGCQTIAAKDTVSGQVKINVVPRVAILWNGLPAGEHAPANCIQDHRFEPSSPPSGTAVVASLKIGQGVSLIVFDVEQLVQLRDGENLVDFRPNVTKLQRPTVGLDLLVQRNQLAQCGTG